MSVLLNPGGKYDLVESQILDAVHSVHPEYRDDLQKQLGNAERRVDIPLRAPEPHGQLQYSDAGLEHAVLLDMLQQADLQWSISGYPKIRAAVKG